MKFKIFIFFLVFSVLFFSCKKEVLKNEIKITVPESLSSIPLLEMNNKIINNRTLKVEIYKDNMIAMAEFVSGKTDILMTGLTQGLAGYNSNKNIFHLATVVWGVSSLITNDRNLKTLEDFRGKTILVPFAKSPLELQLKAVLKKENLSDKIKIEYAPAAQAIAMLLTKKVSGICIHEPLVSRLIIEGKAFKVFSIADKWALVNNGEKKSPQVSIFVKKDFSGKNKKFMSLFVAELKTTIGNITGKPESISVKYKEHFKTDEKVLSAALVNILYDLPEYDKTKELIKNYLIQIEYNVKFDDNFFYKY